MDPSLRHLRKQARRALLIASIVPAHAATGQETLPEFTAAIRSGRPVISWTNPFDKVVQISVQRSQDSLFGFRTIVTMPDPSLAVNGFMDVSAPDTRQYSRIYVQFPYGRFFQTSVKRPSEQSLPVAPDASATNQVIPQPVEERPAMSGLPSIGRSSPEIPKPEDPKDYENIMKRSKGVYVKKLPWRHLQPGDPMPPETAELKVVLPANLFTPSPFLFTNKDGNVVVAMPQRSGGRFSVHFFLPEGMPLFHFDMSKEPILILDKVNFQRSGWFDFEIRQDGRVKERNRIFIPKLRL